MIILKIQSLVLSLDTKLCFAFNRRLKILLNERQTPNLEESIYYFESMVEFIEELSYLQSKLRRAIRYSKFPTIQPTCANILIP